MKTFWTFYQNLETVPHPFRVFGLSHGIYIALTIAAIALIFRAYRAADLGGKRRWQRGIAIYLFVQEMFFYGWTFFSCQENALFETLQLELCTFCLFANFSTLFHENKQVRFFGAVVGMIGGPIAAIYPATVADIYPAFSYRLVNFFMTHGAYILFSLMLLSDEGLLTKKRLAVNTGILAGLLTAVYFFDRRFGTQYMFVGTPPQIGFIRVLYDLVGQYLFLPMAIVILSLYQGLVYRLVKGLQKIAYPRKKQVRTP